MGFIDTADGCTDLECDDCATHLNCEARSAAAVGSLAKNSDWRFYNDGWLCPRCYSRAKKSEKTGQGLNRGNYQLKRSPLKPPQNPLNARSSLKPGKGLQPKPPDPNKPKKPRTVKIAYKSDRARKRDAKYEVARKIQIEKYPRCQFPSCGRIATDVHHVRGRTGSNMWLGPFKSLCRAHHDFVEINKKWAKDNGFSESRHTSRRKYNDN